MTVDHDEVALSRQARSLWGKTDRLDGERWLPLYVHMADSIGMAERIWDHWIPDGTKDVLIRDAGRDATLARRTYLLLAGVHDIGKATPVFQSKPIRFDPSVEEASSSLAWLPERAGLPVRRDFTDPNRPSHPIAGQTILERHLTETYGWPADIARSYASVVGGHHGTPPDDERLREAMFGEPVRMGWNEPASAAWEPVQRELLEFAIRRAGLSVEDMGRMGRLRLSAQAESLLTGAVIMADWMASNSDDDMFRLIAVPGTLNAVEETQDDDVRTWSGLRRRAERAWRNLRLCEPWRPVVNDLHMDDVALDDWFRSRFNLPQGATPRPVQREAATIAAQADDPGLMIIEAPMGEGKTEAALAAAELLAQRTGRGGVCIALPTMATADAMFGRAHAWLDALPVSPGADGKTVWLAHGKAPLNEEFRGIIAASRRAMASWSSVDMEVSDSTRRNVPSPETIVSEWMWGRKKGVLANFLICTVDQVLMGALQMKHVVLRQLALANKVVVIDECHAYDAYMQEYLERILEWLGGFHAPVLLLSATLPERQRATMAEAYLRGRAAADRTQLRPSDSLSRSGLPVRPRRGRKRARSADVRSDMQPGMLSVTDEMHRSGDAVASAAAGSSVTDPSAIAASNQSSIAEAYPLITYSSGAELHMKPVEPSGRSLVVTCGLMPDDDDSLTALLDDLLREGGCIGVICDTVPRAQHVAALLAERYGDDQVRLTHARFMDLDRMDNERELRELLGPHSTRANGRRPERLIVVGTQVLEQSLDIDFDALITDIAPVDLLMQRLGRVHRHVRGIGQQDRPVRLRAAACYIRGIVEWDDGGAPRFDGGVRAVYEEASLMETLGVLGLTGGSRASIMAELPKDIAATVRRAYGEHADEAIPESWRERYGNAVEARTKKQAEKRARAHGYRIKSLRDMDRNDETLVDWFKTAAIDDADDDKGQRAVRDTQETVEVMLLRRCDDGVRLLPWVGDARHGIEPGDVVPTDTVPDDRLALLVSQCSVRLPASMCGYGGKDLDSLIAALEQGCGNETMMWNDSPWLAGHLAVFLEDDGDGGLATAVSGFWVRYDRRAGLCVERERHG
ncbi:CRISPR-associated endonuclease Cas3'' [Bifidobacterium amazonense]|uniref:CRISPR-associated endonuclease Cas3 n=1 Tax=Bifidobacterium amazonense TaxID=2809027 RepID=A0ABS9VXT1_9BIFI|nr:CRISPR-associated endonuclease Cas3'' [Bifidobacterium amazonense]MCH9276908.1 CRISPR-associated endonuclease Cas3'' [Bifidobacterium amazonense]